MIYSNVMTVLLDIPLPDEYESVYRVGALLECEDDL